MAETSIRYTGRCRFSGQNAMQDMEKCILNFEIETLSSFATVKGKKVKPPVQSDLTLKKLYWEEHSSKNLPISYDGVPFMVIGVQVRECCHGPDRHQAEKKKATQEKKARKVDHEYMSQGRKLMQTTKKMDCPAAIHVRSVVRFPSYKIDNNSEWARRKQAKNLRSVLNDGTNEVFFEHHIFVALPEEGAHKNHLTDEIGSMTHNVDRQVINQIHSLVAVGVRDVSEMKRHITSFSKATFPGVHGTSNRFYPSNKCIRNHMYSALALSQISTEDQENLKQHVEQWQFENPEDNYYFVPSPKVDCSDSDGEFIFVHQAAWQRRLLSLYGEEICLMDATYGICKSDVALYFVCVATNTGYITVGCFLLPSETIQNITRGLSTLKSWNPDWSPSFFMTDYDEKEICAIETTFPGCFTYLCDFHREQSWNRWLTANTNKQHRKELLCMMRKIAHSDSEEKFTDSVICLKDSLYWQENERLRIWFEKQWLSASKRWVSFHRQSLENNRVTTTNGLERQHYQLKKHYLKGYTGGTVTSLIGTVVTQFVPDSFQRYREANVKSLSSSRIYNEDAPGFLHNRPRLFQDHCSKRLEAAILIPASNIEVLDNKMFTVCSADRAVTYMLDLGSCLPSCSCPDWKRNHLPCKHMLCILLKVPGCGWEDLSEDFKNSPHINIDRDVCHVASVLAEKTQEPMVDSPKYTSLTRQPKTFKCKATIAVGSRCKMLASSINNMLHLVQKASDYESIYQDMMVLHGKVRSCVPKESGLLRRPQKLGRKVRTNNFGCLKLRRKYRRKIRTSVSAKKVTRVGCSNIVPLDSTFHEDAVAEEADISASTCTSADTARTVPNSTETKAKEDMSASTSTSADTARTVPNSTETKAKEDMSASTGTSADTARTVPNSTETKAKEDMLASTSTSAESTRTVPNSTEAKAKKVLSNILDTRPTGRILFQIGPYTITDHSIHFLNTTLSDEVIDTFMLLMPKQKVYHIDTINMTSIFAGNQDSTGYLKGINLHQYDALIGAVNEDQMHWVLMIIIPGAKCLVYINPMGEPKRKCAMYIKRWTSFLKERSRRKISTGEVNNEGWKVETVPHARQTDGTSCGVFVLRFAKQYLTGEDMNRSWTSQDIKKERRRLQLDILSLGINAEENHCNLELENETRSPDVCAEGIYTDFIKEKEPIWMEVEEGIRDEKESQTSANWMSYNNKYPTDYIIN